jgi:hypothetical protein
MTCSQIWLISFVKGCQCGYITNFKKKRKKKEKKREKNPAFNPFIVLEKL